MEFGFLRETEEKAIKAGIDPTTNLIRTGLDTYLKYIFPEINDWIHDKQLGLINDIKYTNRPDYRSEQLKMIIEFDGLQHYTDPNNIIRDIKNTKLYKFLGYKIIRIPYFIQLTNEIVKILFNREPNIELFNPNIASLHDKITPAYLCPLGIIRMIYEFKQFNQQFEINMRYLETLDKIKSGIDFIYQYDTEEYMDKYKKLLENT